MATVHLVYPAGPQIATPQAIGRNVAEVLSRRHRVLVHPWDAVTTITPGPGDVLLGHPHPWPGTTFSASARRPGWSRILVLAPYSHGEPWRMAYFDPVVRRADQYLAITGTHWFRRVQASPFAHWAPKMVHLDLAVDRGHFPRVKGRFNPPGRRRFIYLGHTDSYKNVAYLSQIARAMPEVEFSWAGRRTAADIPGVRALGFQDFSTEPARALVASHDFLITVGSSDPNPTTILEAMAWGLVPVCTPESGYEDEAGVVNVPLGRLDEAMARLRALVAAPEAQLEELRAANEAALAARFTWSRFASQVLAAVESTARPAASAAPLGARWRWAWTAATCPHAPWRPANVASYLSAVAAHLARAGRGDASEGRPWRG